MNDPISIAAHAAPRVGSRPSWLCPAHLEQTYVCGCAPPEHKVELVWADMTGRSYAVVPVVSSHDTPPTAIHEQVWRVMLLGVDVLDQPDCTGWHPTREGAIDDAKIRSARKLRALHEQAKADVYVRSKLRDFVLPEVLVVIPPRGRRDDGSEFGSNPSRIRVHADPLSRSKLLHMLSRRTRPDDILTLHATTGRRISECVAWLCEQEPGSLVLMHMQQLKVVRSLSGDTENNLRHEVEYSGLRFTNGYRVGGGEIAVLPSIALAPTVVYSDDLEPGAVIHTSNDWTIQLVEMYGGHPGWRALAYPNAVLHGCDVRSFFADENELMGLVAGKPCEFASDFSTRLKS